MHPNEADHEEISGKTESCQKCKLSWKSAPAQLRIIKIVKKVSRRKLQLPAGTIADIQLLSEDDGTVEGIPLRDFLNRPLLLGLISSDL